MGANVFRYAKVLICAISLALAVSEADAKLKVPVEVEGPVRVEIISPETEVDEQRLIRDEDRKHDLSDLDAQWLAARSAKEMVTLSYIQLGFTILTVIAALYSLKISRDAFHSENRPVMVSETPSLASGLHLEQAPIHLNWKVTNQGRGLCFVKGYRLWLCTADNKRAVLQNDATLHHSKIHWPIATTQNWHLNETPIVAPVELRREVGIGKEQLYLYGELTYIDTGKRRYMMRCAFQWNPASNVFQSHADDDWWA